MSEIDTIAAEIAHLYPAVYARLHARWALGEKRPGAESLAVLQHLWQAGPLTVGEAARHFERAPSAVSELVDRLAETDVTFLAQAFGCRRDLRVEPYRSPHAATVASVMWPLHITDASAMASESGRLCGLA